MTKLDTLFTVNILQKKRKYCYFLLTEITTRPTLNITYSIFFTASVSWLISMFIYMMIYNSCMYWTNMSLIIFDRFILIHNALSKYLIINQLSLTHPYFLNYSDNFSIDHTIWDHFLHQLYTT